MSESNLNDNLNEKELFSQVSKAIRENDHSTIDKLLTAEKQEPVQPESDEPAETPASDIEPDPAQDENDETSSEETHSDESTDEEDKQKEEDTSDDPLKQLMERLERIEEENKKLKSQVGRVPNLQRRYQETERKLAELLSKADLRKTKAAKPDSNQTLEKIKALESTDPALAEILRETISNSSVEDNADDILLETLKTLHESRQMETAEIELERLVEAYPEAPTVFRSPLWSSWVKRQTKARQELANSNLFDDVALVYEAFKRDNANNEELTKLLGATAPSEEPAPTEKAKKVQEQREKKLNAPVVTSPKAPAKQQMPDNPELLFKKAYEQALKAQGRL